MQIYKPHLYFATEGAKKEYICTKMDDMTIVESDDIRSVTELRYAFTATPFGEMLTACDGHGLCFAGFVAEGGRGAALADAARRFPCARFTECVSAAVDPFGDVGALHLAGTEFRRRVWRALLTVGRGERISYSALAARAGVPRAVRAAASAVAANPLSIVVPCHRIVRNDGSTGRYYWGSDLKRRLLEWESQ